MHIVPQHAGTPILANQRKASQGMARLCIAPNGFSFPRQYVGENTSQRRAESYMPVLLENVIPSQIKSFAFRNNLFHIMQVLSLLHSGRVINREKFFFFDFSDVMLPRKLPYTCNLSCERYLWWFYRSLL